jgi:hypothetical protein
VLRLACPHWWTTATAQSSGISRNACPPSVGTGVRDHPESVSVIDRITHSTTCLTPCLRSTKRPGCSPGGTFVACTSSRFNDPEFASALPDWGQPFSFDAETAPTLVADVFDVAEVQRWNAPLVTLPDTAAVELFLRGCGLPSAQAQHYAERLATPLTVTQRGALIWATRR